MLMLRPEIKEILDIADGLHEFPMDGLFELGMDVGVFQPNDAYDVPKLDYAEVILSRCIEQTKLKLLKAHIDWYWYGDRNVY